MPNTRCSLRIITSIAIYITIFTLATATLVSARPPIEHKFDQDRAKILGYIVSQHLVRYHFSHKRLDDKLSAAAFDLYIKQLDAQKRFLLKTDVKMLGAYEHYIDDEIRRGMIHLPIYSCEIMTQRIPVVKKMIVKILAQPFNMQQDEKLETDNKKLGFCADDTQLYERWRKTLKYQTANRYLDLKKEQEDRLAGKDKDKKTTSVTKTVGKKTKKEADNDKKPLLSDNELRQQAREKVTKRYTHLLTRMLEDQRQDHFERYLNAISRAYDPHSIYLPPEEKEDFDIHMRGSLEGIGAVLREEDGYIKVVNLIPGGAAEQQGQLEGEDIILKVAEGDEDPIDITDTRIRDAVALIRGPKGTEVRLHVKKPDNTTKIITIIREVIQIKESFVKSMILKSVDGNHNYGYLRIPSFYRDFKDHGPNARNVTRDTKKELEKLQQQDISGIIIDLRNNGGGSLTDAVDTTGLFISHGPVVQIKDSTGKTEVLADNDKATQYSGPLVVLVNKFSASASEILAGALQDYHRAIIIGSEHTHGKGTVQAVIDLDRDTPLRNLDKFKPLGALKITVQKFYRVSGISTQYRGIHSDIIFPDRFKAIKSGEKYIDYSLPWDSIAPCKYQILPNKLPIETLNNASQKRIEGSKKMQRIVDWSNKTQERMDNSKRSLLLTNIISERDELMDDDKKMDQKVPEPVSGKDVKKWREKAKKDPYLIEAIAILEDMGTI